MARAPNSPIEIVVRATVDDPVAEVSWSFVRRQVRHKFSLNVVKDGKGHVIRDNQFVMTYPYTFKQRSEFRTKYQGKPVPLEHTKRRPVNDPQYKDMILSVRKLLADRDLIDEARTAPGGTAVHSYADFVYPTWYRSRTDPYDPYVERVEMSANSPANPALPPEAAASVLDIINRHLPPELTGNTYADGVDAYGDMVVATRDAIVAQIATAKPAMVPVLQGYVAVLNDIITRGRKLEFTDGSS